METFLEILKFTIPALVVFLTAWVLLRNFIKAEQKRMDFQMRLAYSKEVLPLRLQAYERLSVFLERVDPTSLLPRVNQSGISARELQGLLLTTIRSEFEHNMSQQVYVSQEVWTSVRFAKDEIIKVINIIGTGIHPESTGTEYSKKILEFYLQNNAVPPTQKALKIIKAEVAKFY